MIEGMQTTQRLGGAAFTVSVEWIAGAFEYDIQREGEVSEQEIAEALFSIALDLKAKEGLRRKS